MLDFLFHTIGITIFEWLIILLAAVAILVLYAKKHGWKGDKTNERTGK